MSRVARAASSLAVAAALVLGGASALTGCGADEPRREDESSSRRRSDQDPQTKDAADSKEGSALDELVDALGELVSPSKGGEQTKRPATEPVNDHPRPAGTMAPMSPTSAPRLAGSTAVPPIAPPKPKPRPPTPRSAVGIGS